ncbi:DUF6207 family protein [Streptomyces sp. NPDC056628]|uniref:DUF6207 family protein n=1 Tax=Streptomyces sp. NPDC056628 TaxID=3345882 RepID=UPI00369C7C15
MGAQALGQGAGPVGREFHDVGVALPDAVDTDDVQAGPSPLGLRPAGCGAVAAGILSGRGLAGVEVAAADDATALAVQELLAVRCVIAPADRTVREPGEPGVRLRCFLDLRQEPDS